MRAAALALACLLAASGFGVAARAAPPAAPPARVEARSADLLVVGVVRGDAMTIHVSRLIDNAPIRDAVVTVAFRGGSYPTVAEVDGGYTFQARELALPGASAMEFRVSGGGTEQKLSGTLQITGGGEGGDGGGTGSVRQIGWWVLNFAVCGAFLWLWARRKKPEDPPDA